MIFSKKDDKSLEKKLAKALGEIKIPTGGNLADFSGLSEIIITDKVIAFAITIKADMQNTFESVREQAEKAAQKIAKNHKIMVSLTGEEPTAATPQKRQPINNKLPVKGIKKIIAIASGKGGVGKSTVSVNLALALSAQGLKVGLLDADLYGPSIPKMLKLEGKPATREDKVFIPFEAYGIKAMSIGPMVEEGQAVVWRGPMATSALRQLLRETAWGELDILLIDLPPGTGDIQISLAQQVEVDGAVIVSTPQDVALIDAKKAISMFRQMGIKLLGIVENMSYFIAPDTGNRYDIFGHGGAQKAAKDLDIEFLGEVPLVIDIRKGSDAGEPVVATSPDAAEAKAFAKIAKVLAKDLQMEKS